MRVLIDTTCLVAAALPGHEHHAATIGALQRRRASGQDFMVAAHAMSEAYAVLTRLPSPDRLSPADAFELLDRNWGRAAMVALTGTESWRVIRDHAAMGVGGGRIYDGLIAQCARKAKATEILTWNVRHFEPVAGVKAVSPVESQEK